MSHNARATAGRGCPEGAVGGSLDERPKGTSTAVSEGRELALQSCQIDRVGSVARSVGWAPRRLQGSRSVLEFETTMEGKYVNGVDIIRCNDEGRIIEFRVMIRPLQAVNLVHLQMETMLETMAREH